MGGEAPMASVVPSAERIGPRCGCATPPDFGRVFVRDSRPFGVRLVLGSFLSTSSIPHLELIAHYCPAARIMRLSATALRRRLRQTFQRPEAAMPHRTRSTRPPPNQ